MLAGTNYSNSLIVRYLYIPQWSILHSFEVLAMYEILLFNYFINCLLLVALPIRISPIFLLLAQNYVAYRASILLPFSGKQLTMKPQEARLIYISWCLLFQVSQLPVVVSNSNSPAVYHVNAFQNIPNPCPGFIQVCCSLV